MRRVWSVCLLFGVMCLLLGCPAKKLKKAVIVKKSQPKKPRYRPPFVRLPPKVALRENEVYIPGGSFFMGPKKASTVSPDQHQAVSPHHLVTLTRMFAMWKHEVTQGEFEELMRYNPSHFRNCGKNCPVENARWHEAAAFCNKLSRKHGLASCYLCEGSERNVSCRVLPYFRGQRYYQCSGYRLPTEAEWEHAARGGGDEPFYTPAISKWVDHSTFARIAWYADSSLVRYKGGVQCPERISQRSVWERHQKEEERRCGVHPVEGKEPNVYGLYDMLGNVFEWVYDGYTHLDKLSAKDPIKGHEHVNRVMRGCAWLSSVTYCSVYRRFWAPRSTANYLLGFRPVRTLWKAKSQ